MLRNSGEILNEVEYGDVHLDRRDGPDVVLVSARREDSIREGLDLSVRTLAAVFRDPSLSKSAIAALEEALPWVGWLSGEARLEFVNSFISTAQACRSTGGYEPLAKLLNRWKVSAQIMHDPELSALLHADRGEDKAVPLKRPNA